MKTNHPVPCPTSEGWIGSLPISGKAKDALIEIIGGVRNQNFVRATRGEQKLELATDRWRERPAEQENTVLINLIRAVYDEVNSERIHDELYERIEAVLRERGRL